MPSGQTGHPGVKRFPEHTTPRKQVHTGPQIPRAQLSP